MTVFKGNLKDLGDFQVRRIMPQKAMPKRTIGPWIFFDHLGPVNFKAGEGINVRPHPHINLATVTYLFEGEILHQDSVGSIQAIRPGAINLMVAGRGIVHSERQTIQHPHTVHALQLWHALPKEFEETEPAFYHYTADELPKKNNIRVLMGNAFGMVSPVKTFCETLYVEAKLNNGESLTIPTAAEVAVYLVKGSVKINETELSEHEMMLVNSGDQVIATTESLIVIIGGASFGKRYIEWNFVSSRKERIEQAKDDWQKDRFPKVPTDNKEFIPLPR